MGYFAQHQLELLDPDSSPVDHLRDVAPKDREQDHRNYLGRFGFSGARIFEPVAPFSGGEKARLVLALMIRRAPNLLLLDEPTNHLDLEMRQALSVALIEYTGALVVISHDRHLLKSVCDELLIVHDGIVDRFDRSLDDYAAWLREQEEKSGKGVADTNEDAAKSANKKQQRRDQADLRQRLKPLTDKIRKVEKALAENRAILSDLETGLADESLYTDHDRQDELTELVKKQATTKAAIEALEWEWLEATEKLEQAR
ncbi:MAG TPA: ATP-binding cassette domain-containing protein [Gammaproteobacteria bacterium]